MDPNNQNYQFNNAYQQMVTPPEPKKGLPKGMKIMIIVSAIFIVLVSAAAVAIALQKKSSSDTKQTTTTTVAKAKKVEFKEISVKDLTSAAITVKTDDNWESVSDSNGTTEIINSSNCRITTYYGDNTDASTKSQKTVSQGSIDQVISQTKKSVTDFSSEQIGVKEFNVVDSAKMTKLAFVGQQAKYLGADDVRYVINIWSRNLGAKDFLVYESCPEEVWNEQESSVLKKSSTIEINLEFSKS